MGRRWIEVQGRGLLFISVGLPKKFITIPTGAPTLTVVVGGCGQLPVLMYSSSVTILAQGELKLFPTHPVFPLIVMHWVYGCRVSAA